MEDQERPIEKIDIAGENVHWDLREDMSYAGYLQLEKLLSAQVPRTDKHDETMFLVVHQVSELWIKLALHEVGAAMGLIRKDTLEPAFKMLARVSHVQRQLKCVWDVVSTMTPADYVAFRDALGHASGFQSHQYRILEFRLGNKNAELIEVHRHEPEMFAEVKGALQAPSIYDEALRLLGRRGFDVPEERLERDWSEPYRSHPAVEQAWLRVYRQSEKYWDLYELAEKLVDVEDNFHQWRFRHMKTVERIIGFKRGTGGTSGVGFLRKALDLRFFPELWTVRTSL